MNARPSDLDSSANEPIRMPGAVPSRRRPRARDARRMGDPAVARFEPSGVDVGARPPDVPPARNFLLQGRRDAGAAPARAARRVDRSA